MKNLLVKSSLVLALLSSAALAQGAFVGGEGDYSFNSKIKTKNIAKSEKNNFNKGHYGLGFYGGYDFDSYRAYGGYYYDFKARKNAGEADAKWSKHKLLVGADYTPNITENFKAVLGGYAGLGYLSVRQSFENETSKKNFKGLLIGAKAGGQYSFDAHNALEFGLKADKTFYKKNSGAQLRDTSVGIYTGYTYKF